MSFTKKIASAASVAPIKSGVTQIAKQKSYVQIFAFRYFPTHG
jgi:hypothetical protein